MPRPITQLVLFPGSAEYSVPIARHFLSKDRRCNQELPADLDQAKAGIRPLKAERFGKQSENQSLLSSGIRRSSTNNVKPL